MILFNFINDPQELQDYWFLVDNVPSWAHWHLRNNSLWDITLDQRLHCERVIAQDAKWSYWYARQTLEDRFRLGERVIASDPFYSAMYAIRILCDRFPAGEETLRKLDTWDGNKENPRDTYNRHFGTNI